MEVQMLDGLTGILAHIGNDAVAIFQSLLLGQLCDDGKNMAQQSTVLLGQRSGEVMCFLGMTRKCTLACG